MKYKIEPKEWTSKDINPFENNGIYSTCYTGFYLDSIEDDQLINGTTNRGLFHVSVHKNVKDKFERLNDFIKYENIFNRTPIIGSNYIVDLSSLIESLDFDTFSMRETDPSVLVHSTNLNAWDSIKSDYYLKS